jgi:hypothetical protein
MRGSLNGIACFYSPGAKEHGGEIRGIARGSMEPKLTLSPTRGVYFLANDRVSDLAIAFLNSFRRFNTNIPLCLIPFDDNYKYIATLASQYRFMVFEDHQLLSACDRISKHFHGQTSGQYRKFAIWEGPFQEFLYIDIDTIVLANIDFAFELLHNYDVLTSHSNIERIRKWVWKDSIFIDEKLTREQISYAANTGFIVSRREALRLSDIITERLSDALALLPHMELLCAEQPFMNYVIVTSLKRYSSLFDIARREKRIDIPLERWAGAWFGDVRDGKVIRPPTHPPFLLVHWAGEWHRGCHQLNSLWQFYRHMTSTSTPLTLAHADPQERTVGCK